jgi:hypothetical protein
VTALTASVGRDTLAAARAAAGISGHGRNGRRHASSESEATLSRTYESALDADARAQIDALPGWRWEASRAYRAAAAVAPLLVPFEVAGAQ